MTDARQVPRGRYPRYLPFVDEGGRGMEHVSIARVALAAATYAIDRPYECGSLSLLERETAVQRD